MHLSITQPQEPYWLAMSQAFLSEQELRQWGGPHLHLPLDLRNLESQLDLTRWESRFLVDGHGVLVGFGQYQRRFERCHLGRLFIWPAFRRRGNGRAMIKALAQEGCQNLKTSEISLWVLNENVAAFRLYQKIGFEVIPYPGPDPFPNSHFMTTELPRLLAA